MLNQNYESFIKKFIDKGYKCIKFNELNNSKDRQLILRHDIDLEIDLALKMAKIENNLAVQSTYFFLLSNASYNLISSDNVKKVKEIKNLGHTISLHFDMAIYKNPKKGFEYEKDIFSQTFDNPIDIVSIHRPIEKFLENPENYLSTENTYQKKYTKDNITYFADSGGEFRFGNPLDSKAFHNVNNIQLLFHPIWWIDNKNTINNTVNNIIDLKSKKIKKHFEKSIKNFTG